jgi:hypothetical protein
MSWKTDGSWKQELAANPRNARYEKMRRVRALDRTRAKIHSSKVVAAYDAQVSARLAVTRKMEEERREALLRQV